MKQDESQGSLKPSNVPLPDGLCVCVCVCVCVCLGGGVMLMQ